MSKNEKSFDLAKEIAAAKTRIFERKMAQNRDVKNHAQSEADMDVKKSYDESLEMCKDKHGKVDADLLFHLEEIIMAGPIRKA